MDHPVSACNSRFDGGEDVYGVGCDVAEWEVGDVGVALLLVEVVRVVHDLGGHSQVVVGQHHALRRTSRAGGVDLQEQEWSISLYTTFC